MLSGMSPGGLLSTGAGRCDLGAPAGELADPAGAGVPEEVTEPVVGPVVAEDPALPAAAGVLFALHPVAAAAASARATAGPARRNPVALRGGRAGCSSRVRRGTPR